MVTDGNRNAVRRHWAMAAWLAVLVIAGRADAVAQPSASAPSVIVAPARAIEFVDRIEALGTTQANETVQITSKVTEKVAEIRFDDGQRVAVGDVLVVLEKAEEEADFRAAEAVKDERKVAFDRVLELESRDVASTAQLDERRAALQQAEANIAMIQSRINDRIIRAPFSGVLGLRKISLGALIEPGDLITTLDDLTVIKLDFTVPAIYLTAVRPGLSVVATSDAFPGRRFDGEVRSVDSRVDPVTRSFIARAVLTNDDGALRPGLLMNVELLKNPRTAIVVSEQALIPLGRRNYVLVVDGDREGGVVERREVTLGGRRVGLVELRDGVAVGELLITHGTMLVRPGQHVTIRAVEDSDQPLGDLLRPPEVAAPADRI